MWGKLLHFERQPTILHVKGAELEARAQLSVFEALDAKESSCLR